MNKERLAKAICFSFGFNPMERLEADDETIWRWEAYLPATDAVLTELIKIAEEQEEKFNEDDTNSGNAYIMYLVGNWLKGIRDE